MRRARQPHQHPSRNRTPPPRTIASGCQSPLANELAEVVEARADEAPAGDVVVGQPVQHQADRGRDARRGSAAGRPGSPGRGTRPAGRSTPASCPPAGAGLDAGAAVAPPGGRVPGRRGRARSSAYLRRWAGAGARRCASLGPRRRPRDVSGRLSDVPATILDGKATAAAIKSDLTARVAALAEAGHRPGLGTLLVGTTPAASGTSTASTPTARRSASPPSSANCPPPPRRRRSRRSSRSSTPTRRAPATSSSCPCRRASTRTPSSS